MTSRPVPVCDPMTYARLCEHGEVKEHEAWRENPTVWKDRFDCPGGSVLPDDTLVIVKEDVDDPECGDCDHLPRHDWPDSAYRALDAAEKRAYDEGRIKVPFRYYLDALAAAQGSQE